jgi:hypothetical protein
MHRDQRKMNEFLHPTQHIELPNVEESPAPDGTAPEEPDPEKKKQRSLLKRLSLWVAYGFLLLVVLLVGAGLALTYYFPAERIRPIVEKELTGFLKMPVSIESLDLNLLSGITISRLKLGENQPLFEVNDIVLDYDLTKLMQGEFVINQVLVAEPKLNLISVDGVWNFQPLLELGASDEPPPAVEKKSEGLPAIPIALDLREFAIRNIQVNVDMDGKMKSRLEGLSLDAHGKINSEEIDVALNTTMAPPADGEHNLEFFSSQGKGIDVKALSLVNMKVSTQDLNNIRLSGTLGLTKNQFLVGDPLPSPDLSVAIDLTAAVQEQGVNIQQLDLNIGENNRVDITGSASNLAKDPRFDIKLNEAAFNIEDLVKWAGTMIPDIKASGNLLVSNVEVKGHMPGFEPQDIELVNANIAVKDLSAQYPALQADLKGVDVNIDLADVQLKNSVPENLNGKIRVTMDQGQAQGLKINGLNHDLQIIAKNANLADVSLIFATAIKEAQFSSPELGTIKTGLDLNGSTSANINSGDIHFLKANYSLGSAVKGDLKGNAKDFGKAAFYVEQDLDVNFTELRALIPKKLLQKIDGYPTAGETAVHALAQGRLDENFMPVQALVNTRIELKGIDAQLKNPPAEVNQISATISFPVDYIPSRGAKIPRLDLNARFKNVKALEKVELGRGEIKTQLTMGGYYPLTTQAKGKIPITNKTTIKLDRVASNAPEVVVTGLIIDTSLKTDLYGQDVKNLTFEGKVSVLDVEGVKEVKTGKISTAFAVDLNDLSMTKTNVSVDLQVDPPTPEKLNGAIPIGPITFKSRSRQNLKTGAIEIDQVTLRAPTLLNLDLTASLKDWGKTFNVDTRVTETELNALWEKVPKALRTGMENLEVGGSVNFALKAKGTIPEKFDLKKSSIPIVANAGFGLGNASLNWPSQGIAIDKMSTEAKVDFKEGEGEVSGKFAIARLFLKNVLGEEWLNPQFDFKYALEDFNKFTVREHLFTIKKFGISHSLKGRVDGLKPFLTGKASMKPQELTRRLDISLATSNKLDIQKAINEGTRQFLQGIQASGSLGADVTLKMTPKKIIELDGTVAFDQFNAKVPDGVQVTDLSGRIPFNKTLFLDRNLIQPLDKSFLASRKGFFTQLRGFSQHKNNLTLKEVQASGHQVSNIALDLLYKNNRLMAEKFLFDILDGSVAGNLFVIPTPEGPELNFSTEFAGLNFGALTGRTKTSEKAESEIDGNLQLGVKLKQGQATEPITLDQISANIAVTRIGAETLDRFLLYLDPEESKPAIVDTRAKLKLASPHRIVITVENGNLNVSAWLKNKILGDIIQAPELKRVPITSLKEFRNLTEQLKTLTGLRDALNYLAARGMEFTEEGEILLY